MMTIANRLRGTYGWFARVFGLTATIAVYLFSGSWVIAVLMGVGYWLGELWCGWGDHIGNRTEKRYNVFPYFPPDGCDAGVRWLTSVIVYPKLWNVHLANAKKGLYNWYVRIVNAEFKGWSLARLFRINAQSKLIETFVIDKAALYSNVFLVVRGFVWWLLPMIGVGLWTGSAMVAVVGLFVLSFGWIICADLGYYFRDKIAIEKFGLSYVGGWELQEGFYGVLQDLVLIGVIVWKLMS